MTLSKGEAKYMLGLIPSTPKFRKIVNYRSVFRQYAAEMFPNHDQKILLDALVAAYERDKRRYEDEEELRREDENRRKAGFLLGMIVGISCPMLGAAVASLPNIPSNVPNAPLYIDWQSFTQ